MRLSKILSKSYYYFKLKKIIGKKVLQLAEKLHAKYQFSIVHGHEIFVGDEAGVIGRVCKIPSVFTIHGLFDYHLNLFGQATMDIVLKNLRQVDKLIAVSSIAANSYIQKGLEGKIFSIIPNGIRQLKSMGQIRNDIKQFAKGRKILLSVGFLAFEKRFDLSIRTLAKIPSETAVLVIVGRGQKEHELRHLANELQCADRVLFLGEILPTDMTNVYSSADILLHPSIVDSFSMVCLEAMSHGLPVIATENIGLIEYIQSENELVVVKPNDENALYSETMKLLNNPNKCKNIGLMAKKRANKMTWQPIILKVNKVYSDLTSVQNVN